MTDRFLRRAKKGDILNRGLLFVAMAAGTLALQGQVTLSGEAQQAYTNIKNNILKAADKMPEENYSFKPSPEIRTFGALVAHIADSQTRLCNGIMGKTKAGTAGTKTAKADIVAALKDSFTDCDAAFDGLTEANAKDVVKMGPREFTHLGALLRGVIHDNEEYGYLAVYLRLKSVVPPSSEGR